MYLKLLGACLTVAGTGALGFYLGNRYLQRVRDLERLINLLNFLKTEIRYKATPLPEIFAKMANSEEGTVAKLFEIKDRTLPVNQGLKKALAEGFSQTALLKREQEILLAFAEKIGISDLREQENLLNYTCEQLKLVLAESRQEAEKNVKLVNYLGVLVGAFLVLLFF
ncbi:stage III sporulation protein SpoIIIAB [Carboxydothermus ferrireducens]|uniref:Stage III sporulation protein AB n=1 Tax=Carboxydothermus ferrireducens DSM 11255 TaxID=1119529 RepID=A0ABX2RFW5_9THEO|nr:stage III sporulation protein SpoIIIAB [Carboxydothermus ferrireducens]NYE58718.1 stage III sporulation protein AB [Carboxydothermus ferrireducens DSM 11255]